MPKTRINFPVRVSGRISREDALALRRVRARREIAADTLRRVIHAGLSVLAVLPKPLETGQKNREGAFMSESAFSSAGGESRDLQSR